MPRTKLEYGDPDPVTTARKIVLESRDRALSSIDIDSAIDHIDWLERTIDTLCDFIEET